MQRPETDNPYTPPDTPIAQPDTGALRRGVWLTLFLVYATLVCLSSPFVFALAWKKMLIAYPKWLAVGSATIAVLRLVSVVGMWFWSRAAVVLYIMLSMVAISLSLAVGYKLSLVGIVGAIAVLLFFLPHWKHMPWLFANSSSKPTPLRGEP